MHVDADLALVPGKYFQVWNLFSFKLCKLCQGGFTNSRPLLAQSFRKVNNFNLANLLLAESVQIVF